MDNMYRLSRASSNRDKKITDLIGTVKDVYSFVDTVKALPDKISILEDTIMEILKQTVECVFFIREYCGHGFGGMPIILCYLYLYVYSVQLGRVIRQSLSNTAADAISKFSQTFMDLKIKFDSSINVQTAFVSFRISEVVQQMG
jgi:hypothetical protein